VPVLAFSLSIFPAFSRHQTTRFASRVTTNFTTGNHRRLSHTWGNARKSIATGRVRAGQEVTPWLGALDSHSPLLLSCCRCWSWHNRRAGGHPLIPRDLRRADRAIHHRSRQTLRHARVGHLFEEINVAKRNSNGRIKRTSPARADFMRRTGYQNGAGRRNDNCCMWPPNAKWSKER